MVICDDNDADGQEGSGRDDGGGQGGGEGISGQLVIYDDNDGGNGDDTMDIW